MGACVQCGDMKGAEEYFGQMKQLECADVLALLKRFLNTEERPDRATRQRVTTRRRVDASTCRRIHASFGPAASAGPWFFRNVLC